MATRTISSDDKPAPSRPVLAGATLVSQLLGAIAFALALLWFVKLGNRSAPTIAVMIAGALCVFAGGHAHRGSVIAVLACVAFDIAIAVACFAVPAAQPFVAAPVAWLAPAALPHLAIAMVVVGSAGAIASVACLLALPQARRFGAWRDAQILRAARVSRG